MALSVVLRLATMKSLLCILAALCTTEATSHFRSPIRSVVSQRSEAEDFYSFGKSLGLSDSVILPLEDDYGNATSPAKIAQLACLVAQASIGQNQVDTPPLDQTVVEENWYVKTLLTSDTLVNVMDKCILITILYLGLRHASTSLPVLCNQGMRTIYRQPSASSDFSEPNSLFEVVATPPIPVGRVLGRMGFS